MDIENFSLEQCAGQRLMVGFEGIELNDELMFLIDTIKVGGIILFAQNLSNPEQIKHLCSSAQEYARSHLQPSLFIAIDQEGGKVARLKKPFTLFPGNPTMEGPEDARHFALVTAAELKKIGINMNLAPVMDVAPKGINSVMAARVFGHDPQCVAELGATVIQFLQKNKIMSVAKHFPGIGPRRCPPWRLTWIP
jgi:beta-N-acetylhexosaminidase